MQLKNVILFVLFSCILLTNALSQNLVPNPGFENNSLSPGQALPYNFSDWTSPPNCNGSPDVCKDQPNNYLLPPRTGTSMARTGSLIFGWFMNITNRREYLHCQLISPMIAGESYLVSYWVCNFNTADRQEYWTNSIGANYFNSDNIVQSHISSTQISGTGNWDPLTTVTPTHIFTSPFDTSGAWMQVSYVYTASGGEEWFTVGNFNDDANTNFWWEFSGPNGSNNSFVYYDDFSIEQINPLPVDFGALNTECEEESSTLYWHTLSERDNDRFVIEKSADLINFKEIATIKATGNSQTRKDYSWQVSEASHQGTYYRLSQIDKNGKRNNLGIAASACAKNYWKVYPNPSSSSFNIEMGGYAGPVQLSITDKLGKVVFVRELMIEKNIVSIEDFNAEPGVYSLAIKTNDREEIIRIVKF